jgi:hypothetical protein
MGRSQTVLSKMAAPPRKRNGLKVFLILALLFFGCAAFNGFQMNGLDQSVLICGSIAALVLFLLINVWRRQQEVYENALEDYESMHVCQRCGTFYSA